MTTAKTKTRPKPQIILVKKDDLLDLIIIGAGPAGLAAAIYAARAGLKILVIEKTLAGGSIAATDRIENYPGFPEGIPGQELGQKMEEQAKRLGVQFSWGTVTKIENHKNLKKVQMEEKTLECKSIIIASGTTPKKLGIKGEEEFRGRGVSYCAICDAPFYKGKQVAVVGGGNAAIEEALFLANFAAKVSVIHRRSTLRADAVLVTRANLDPKIYFIWDSVVEEIRGEKKVNQVAIRDLKTGKVALLPAEGVFIYIGSTPNTGFLEDSVKLDKNNFIVTNEEMKTSAPGIFAAGDVRKKALYQVATAVSDGAIAATSARKYLEELSYPK